MRVLLLPPTYHYAMEYPAFLSLSDFPAAFPYLASSLKKAGHEVFGCNPNNIVGYVNAETMLKDVLTKRIKEVQPELIGLGGLCTDYKFLKDAIGIIRGIDPKIPIVLGGQIVTNDAEDVFKMLKPDYAIVGEGENAIIEVIKGNLNPGIVSAPPPILDDLPSPDYEPFGIQDMLDNYSMATRLLYRYSRLEPRVYGIVTARGCPFSCLQGDTLIDTLEGLIPIKQLVGREDVKVLTQNPLDHELTYAKAIHIAKTKKNATLVRVSFDDYSFIDCTPDHRFMAFMNGNQYVAFTDYVVEAKDLQVGQSVRAVKYRIHPSYGYIEVEYGRYQRRKQHRLVMEGAIERYLTRKEVVHHKDQNKLNNAIDNLLLTDKHNHFFYHPEVTERMKLHNPMRNPGVSARQSATLKETIHSGEFVPYMCTAKGKAEISRIATERALSDKNPLLTKNRKRASINHKVVSVETLSQAEDVYCMEVPGYDWFFANGVLVHNCSFCIDHHRGYRERSIENIMAEIKVTYDKYHFNILLILDELFAVNKERMRAFCQAVIEGKKQYDWDFDWMFQTHASAKLDLDTLKLAKQAGCVSFSYGLESASPTILKSMNKKIKPEQVIEAIKLSSEAEIGFSANLIFGDIAETMETMAESFAFWFEHCKSVFVFLGNLVAYPGSAVFEACRQKGMFPDKQAYYESIDKQQSNITTIPDREYNGHLQLIQFIEKSWLFTKTTQIAKMEKVESDALLLRLQGGSYFKITTYCPYCKKEIEYIERLLDSKQPFWLGTGCPNCGAKIKVVS